MNVKKLFLALQAKNITDVEYRYVSKNSFSCNVFRHELTNYSVSTNSVINVDAIIDNKLAMVTTENTSNNNIDNIVNQLIESAQYTNKKDAEIFKDKVRYRHFKYFNKDLANIPNQQKIDMVFAIEKKLKEMDTRIEDVEVGYEEVIAKREYQNTAGIKLKTARNSYSFATEIVLNDTNGSKQTEYYVFEDNDFSKFNVDNFVKEAYEKAIKRLNGINIETKQYKVIFDPSVVDDLLDFYVSQLNAESILKNSSWFKNKLNTQVANKIVTILETPLKRNHEFNGFDAQGVPCVNRPLIKKGVLLSYLHNLETAKKFNVAPTGNAAVAAAKIGIKSNAIHLKPGRLSKEELINKVNNGVYITSLEGFHAGMNAESGHFSLKAEGFVIKDGKLDKFINMMTVSSNLYDIFNNVKAISQNIEYIHNGIVAPCIYVDKISVAG
ncbi:MAG: TldD/PmbA family protein [Bacilli bacterium]|nr:TldD/PmbA family protein [Bacilli bacterium]